MSGRLSRQVAELMLVVTVFSGQVMVRYASGEEEVVKPAAGEIVGQVVDCNFQKGQVKVKVAEASEGCEALVGETLLFVPKWVKIEEKWRPDPENLKLLRSVIAGDTVAITFKHDEHYRAEALEVTAKVPKEGRLLGKVVAAKRGDLRVEVTKTAEGAEMLEGVTLDFYAEWSKVEGKWVPDPAQVELFAKAKVGDMIEVSYYYNEHYRIRSLEVEPPAAEEEPAAEEGEDK